MGGKQSLHHLERAYRGNPRAQQHAGGAIQARELVDLHAAAERGDGPQALVQPRPRLRAGEGPGRETEQND